ncbi:MAG: putative 3-methyladenine DNA glycosylase [Candidatus Binatia bacterium]|nr:MAG: putative 3-methyladenine DNA glycosylase [Candidatus Binatia bacterium]
MKILPFSLESCPPRRGPLDREFFRRDALVVARDLLGTLLVHESPEGTAAGYVVETEAYRGPRDRAAHSFGGRRTARNEVMYGPPGHAYVYFVYGMHYCFNVVVADVGVPHAVLVRALLPVRGLDLMRERRGRSVEDRRLCQGPANLCRALGIDRRHNGADLLDGPLRIEPGLEVPDRAVGRAARVGVSYAGADARRPWRFYVRGEPSVSALPTVVQGTRRRAAPHGPGR